ncbi:MAG: hypothetical protein ACFFCZ_30240 [Promethearchaeota archaeon]
MVNLNYFDNYINALNYLLMLVIWVGKIRLIYLVFIEETQEL